MTPQMHLNMMPAMKVRWFVRGDIDGFFGLFIDNLVQLILIDLLCREVCGMPAELVAGRILPGAAASILLGNLFLRLAGTKADGSHRP